MGITGVQVTTGVRVLITAGVGVVGAAAGFTHTHEAAVQAGQEGWLAWADAVVIECMAIVAGLQLRDQRKSHQRGWFALAVLVVSFVVQMGAQVSTAPASPAGWLFAAVPALACLVVVKFCMHRPDVSRDQYISTSVNTDIAEVATEPVAELVAVPAAPQSQPRVATWPPAA